MTPFAFLDSPGCRAYPRRSELGRAVDAGDLTVPRGADEITPRVVSILARTPMHVPSGTLLKTRTGQGSSMAGSSLTGPWVQRRRVLLRPAGILLAATLVVSAGCAAAVAPALPSPAEIPALEQSLAASPATVSTLVRLGVAYREAGRLDDALSTLRRAVDLDATEPAGIFYLGLTYEDLQRPGEARDVYDRYLEVGTNEDLKRLISGRLPLLERQELLLATRDALASEASLGGTQPRAGTVAVFPFAYEGPDPLYRPLGRALAEMVVTDLSATDRLTVLERTRIQLLIDEMDLGETGLVDTLTAARSGRLVGAERIVQGQLSIPGPDQLRMQAAIVGASTGQLSGAPIVEQDALRSLFEAQKRLVLNLYTSLGIQLTAAERERISQVPTASLQALLAWGQCLEAEDAGDFGAAATLCGQAATLDPGFTAARMRSERAGSALASSSISIERLAVLGTPELAPAGGVATAQSLPGLEAIQALVPPELPRAPAPEVLATEPPDRTTSIDIIITRP